MKPILNGPQSWEHLVVADLAAPADGSLVGNTFGSRLKASEYVDEGVPLLRGENLSTDRRFEPAASVFVTHDKARELDTQICVAGDVVFTQQGSVGQVGVIPEETGHRKWLVSQSQMRLRVDPKRVEPLFVYYYFRHPSVVERLKSVAIVTGVPHINLGILRRFPVLCPALVEQQRIVGVLGALDDKIELNRKMNRTLEEIAQTLFRAWFVDFEGETDLVESELGPIPRGWSAKHVADLADLNPENWSRRNDQESIRYLDLSAVDRGEILETREMDFSSAPSRARRRLRDGDTIIGTVRPANRSYALVQEPASNLTGSTGFAVLRPKRREACHFLYLSLTQDTFIQYLASVAHGSAYPAVHSGVIHSAPLVVPPVEKLRAFEDVVRPMFRRMTINRRQSRTLAALRDTLLPKLISGEIRVPGAEEIAADAGASP